MILMALDHTRDFFGATGVNPTDPARTTVETKAFTSSSSRGADCTREGVGER